MQLLLQQNEIIEIGRGKRGTEIACHEGRCWVTVAGDDRDCLLFPGGRVRVFGRGLVLITALDQARIQLLSCPEKEPRAAAGLIGRLWLQKKRAFLQ